MFSLLHALGVWITELSKQVPPSVQLYGVDIQDRLFPKPANTPKNVHFSRHSLLSLPAGWGGAFRLINQRLLVCAFTRPEWKIALHEIRRVLAPGGRAQFTEAHLATHNAGPATKKLEDAVQAVYAARGIYYRAPETLPDMLRDAGYVNVRSKVQMLSIGASWGGEDGITLSRLVIGMFSGHRGPILKLKLMDEAEFDELLESTTREWDERPGMSRVYTTVYADKVSPSSFWNPHVNNHFLQP